MPRRPKKTQPAAPSPELLLRQRAQRLNKTLITVVILVVLAGLVRLGMMLRDPEVPLLVDHGGAKWIIADTPFDMRIRAPGDVLWKYRKTMVIEKTPANATLRLWTFKTGRVYVDGRAVFDPGAPMSQWKSGVRFDLVPFLSPGQHEILIDVINRDGPPALLAYCDEIRLRTAHAEGWEASTGPGVWGPAREAAQRPEHAAVRQFISMGAALQRAAPLLAVTLAIVLAFSFLTQRSSNEFLLRRLTLSPSVLRWVLIAAWAVMAINNFATLPPQFGFDAKEHFEYAIYVMERFRLPLATEGWQMFQAPLYYVIAAAVLRGAIYVMGIRPGMDIEPAISVLRLVNIACGMAQIQLCYRIMRIAVPARRDLQNIGVILAGLLPMNLYLSQSIGNEALAGMLSAWAICLAFQIAQHPERARSFTHLGLLGAVLGLSLLSKVTPFLLLAPLLIFVAATFWLQGRSVVQCVRAPVIIVAIAAAIGSWYYIRNWVELGRPFVGGWDPTRTIVWWQDPGYRTPGDLFTFGRSLVRPMDAPVLGFWDALYATFWTDGFMTGMVNYESRPPWNEPFMLSGAVLGLPLTLAMLAGAASVWIPWRGSKSQTLSTDKSSDLSNSKALIIFALAAVAIYIAAILNLYLKLPIYSTVKATYTIGLIPCFSILMVAGINLLPRRATIAAAVHALIACWAVNSYSAYFVIHKPAGAAPSMQPSSEAAAINPADLSSVVTTKEAPQGSF